MVVLDVLDVLYVLDVLVMCVCVVVVVQLRCMLDYVDVVCTGWLCGSHVCVCVCVALFVCHPRVWLA